MSWDISVSSVKYLHRNLLLFFSPASTPTDFYSGRTVRQWSVWVFSHNDCKIVGRNQKLVKSAISKDLYLYSNSTFSKFRCFNFSIKVLVDSVELLGYSLVEHFLIFPTITILKVIFFLSIRLHFSNHVTFNISFSSRWVSLWKSVVVCSINHFYTPLPETIAVRMHVFFRFLIHL